MVVIIDSIDGLYNKWMVIHTACGRHINGKAGYLRSLLDIAEEQFNERPKIEGLKIRIWKADDAMAEAILFRGLWIKDKVILKMRQTT